MKAALSIVLLLFVSALVAFAVAATALDLPLYTLLGVWLSTAWPWLLVAAAVVVVIGIMSKSKEKS